ncbi:meiosis-specific with OB domain-containing protein isoform X2 [Bicyclus anynana]|uniref:Meiosis-specific with OB domain-containing protein isoform X2 n=1 Tax=Bicyclus anynana TaxID=110368 RepID=A0ABM3LRK1_BICAN|nr:meiosis-specific with OB domain-containing protein isoform X2 [Bicyclus anynana]
MAGVRKVCLNSLNIKIDNALIVGIIIAKNSPRTIGQKKKNGESRGVMSFTLRDSIIDTINANVWGSEYFVITFYERFLVGDVVSITNPKICIKGGDNEMYRPQVTSPFCLSLNEGMSDMYTFDGDAYGSYLPLLHVPTKPCAGYCGLSEVLKITGTDMTVRTIEIMDNTTPAPVILDTFDIDTIQRAEQWRPLESVLFVADARVSWRNMAARVQTCSRTVITHQPHTPEAESLRLYMRNQSSTGDGEAAMWAAWSGERANTACVSQIRDRLSSGVPFCAALHALLTHLDLDDFVTSKDGSLEELKVRFADHTGELNARIPVKVVEDAFGYSANQLVSMSADDRASLRWRFLLEQCCTKIAVTSARLVVLSLRRASAADPIPLY